MGGIGRRDRVLVDVCINSVLDSCSKEMVAILLYHFVSFHTAKRGLTVRHKREGCTAALLVEGNSPDLSLPKV